MKIWNSQMNHKSDLIKRNKTRSQTIWKIMVVVVVWLVCFIAYCGENANGNRKFEQ